jgi:putative transcriptional regulator
MSKKTILAKTPKTVPAATSQLHDEFGMTAENWARLHAKTDADIEVDCADDPDLKPWPKDKALRMRRISRAKFIRQHLGMSQPQFAKAFGIPIGTLRDWEQHRAEPDKAALAYLEVIAAKPDVVRDVLSKKASGRAA